MFKECYTAQHGPKFPVMFNLNSNVIQISISTKLFQFAN